jgi:hypothetical protein
MVRVHMARPVVVRVRVARPRSAAARRLGGRARLLGWEMSRRARDAEGGLSRRTMDWTRLSPRGRVRSWLRLRGLEATTATRRA